MTFVNGALVFVLLCGVHIFMFLIRFFHFISGYVKFTASGGFPERFLNLCSRNGIPLWNIRGKGSVLHASTPARFYKQMRPFARKSGMKLKISAKCGLPFFFKKHRRRFGLAAALAVLIVVVSIMSTRIWTLEVSGNSHIPEEDIIAVFEDLGVKVGAGRGKIDITATEIAALDTMEGLLWVSLNISGSNALIEVREKKSAAVQEEPVPGHIVALQDGQLVTLEVYSGTQLQKPGNAVTKGELLISGVTENKDGTVNFNAAEGYAVARTIRKIQVNHEPSSSIFKISKVKKHYTINFFGLRIPLGRARAGDDADEYYEETRWAMANNIKLPIGVLCRRYTYYEKAECSCTPERAALLASEAFFTEYEKNFKLSQLINSNVRLTQIDTSCTISGEFTCYENIGISTPLLIEEGNPPS